MPRPKPAHGHAHGNPGRERGRHTERAHGPPGHRAPRPAASPVPPASAGERAGHGQSPRRRSARSAAGCPHGLARPHRRLHRLLRLHRSRDDRRVNDATRQSASPQLQVDPRRLPRSILFHRGEWHEGQAAQRADRSHRPRSTPALRAFEASRLRTGDGDLRGGGKRARFSRAHSGRGVEDLWTVPAQRLVGPRHPEVGVPAPRSFSGQELRHLDQPVGGDGGGAGSVPRRGGSSSGGRPNALAAPEERPGPGPRSFRCGARSVSFHARDAVAWSSARAPVALEPGLALLDARADDRPSHQRRMQPESGRSSRDGHGEREGEGLAGLPSRADHARPGSNSTSRMASPGRFWRMETR